MNKKEYQEYLQSPHWKRCVYAMHRIKSEDCELCLQPFHNYHIHHLSYDNIGHEQFEDLMRLCDICHKQVHDDNIKIRRKQSYRNTYFHHVFNLMVYEGYEFYDARSVASTYMPDSVEQPENIADILNTVRENIAKRANNPTDITI